MIQSRIGCPEIVALLAKILLAGLLGGCSPNESRPGVTTADTAMARNEAFRLATERALAEGIRAENYDVSASRSEGAWWVRFEKKLNAIEARGWGWPEHFSVRVTDSGETKVFKGR